MLTNRNILCISNPLWEGDYAKTIVELMKVLARKNKVLYIDNPYTVKDLIDGVRHKKGFPVKRTLGLEKRLRKIITETGEEVHVLTPPLTLTINFLPRGTMYKKLLQLNGWITTRSIKKALAELNMNDDLIDIVAFNPGIGMHTGRNFNEKLLIYHCYDAIEAANWMKKHGPWQEKEFMKKVDATIVTSQGLYEKKKSFTKNCFLVKNAVNIDLFKKAFTPEIHNKKTVGYIGSIDDRLDYELLEHVISSMPDVEFLFVGRIIDENGEKVLRKFSNVKLEGAKPVTSLPGYLSRFSLGIIPFAKNEFTKGIYPLKINEYLAAGVPVVTTDFSYLNEFEKVARIASSKELFKNFIEEELANDTLEKKKERLAVAESNSWEQRVEEISEIITKLESNGQLKVEN